MSLFGRRLALCLSLPLWLGLASAVTAQTASLVKDIVARNAAVFGADPVQMTPYQGRVVFSATEPSTGQELWITDGSGSGTRLLADLNPGSFGSIPRVLGTVRGLLVGLAFQETSCCGSFSRAFLWSSDGTREGTRLLPSPDFRVGIPFHQETGEPDSTASGDVVVSPDAVYFTGCIANQECGLWRSDGTADGTRRLLSFGGNGFSGGPTELTLASGRLFFLAGRQLWTSDGTEAGTVLVRELPESGTPRQLAALGSKVLLLAGAVAPGTGEELWVSDGTAAGTNPLTAFEPLSPFAGTRFLKNLGGRIYLTANDVTHGDELWESDGTAAGTRRITDFGFHDPFNGPDGFDYGLLSRAIEKLGDRLVFWASDGLSRLQPWSNQGTFASTVPLCSGCVFQDGFTAPFTRLGGRLLFVPDDGFFSELWVTDGTPTGTRKLGQIQSDLTLVSGAAYFQGPGADVFGSTSALWVSDGTVRGTHRVAAVRSELRDRVRPVAALGSRLLFAGRSTSADEFYEQQELWASDGTAEGTYQVSEIGRAGGGSGVDSLVALGSRAFFTALDPDNGVRHAWRSTAAGDDASEAAEPFFSDSPGASRLVAAGGKVFLIASDFDGVRLVRIGDDGPGQTLAELDRSQQIFYPVEFLGRLYFVVAADRRFGVGELWQSDGTPDGTHRAVDLPELSGVSFLKVIGAQLWFLASGGSAQVWLTDGTQIGTYQVSGLGGGSRSRQDPEFTRIGSFVYFVALRPGGDDFDPQLWKSDGTPQGTVQVSDFPALNATRAFPSALTAFQGSLYFFASLPTVGRALWRSDGTTAGTVRVRDFSFVASQLEDAPGYGLTVLGNRLVFAPDDGVHGIEPWTSDGTAAGTALLRDVWPGPTSSRVTAFTAAGGRLYFAAHDGAHGFELWRTDGTEAGTRLVQDLAPEGASSFPAHLTAAGDRLYFSADDGLTGDELWTLPLSGPACRATATNLCLQGGRFQVSASWTLPGDSFHPEPIGPGNAVPLTADTGYFWFFNPENVEAVVKVLDGIGVNGHFWTFYGALSNVEYTLTVTDTQTGLARRYVNPRGQFASVGDTQSFGPQGAKARPLPSAVGREGAPLLVTERLDPKAATGTCVPGANRLCLNGGRFAVETTWKDFAGNTGAGTAGGITPDTGYFWFFDAANVEVVLKVLDGSAVNGHYWVFYGALSNVEYTLTVTDTMTGTVKTYRNPSGRFASAGDTAAF